MTEPSLGHDRLALLQTFVTIVEAGSLSAAALRMDTSQPTVSRRLQLLERMLGLRLLRRSTHAMTLTEDGERCFARARDLLDQWQAIEADMRGLKDDPRGTLRVLAPHAFGQDQLIVPVVEYLRQYPETSIEWILHDRLPDFIAEGLDCAIRVGTVEYPGLVAVHIADVPRIPVCRPELLPGGAVPTHPSQLGALPWLALQTFYRDEVVMTHRLSGEQHRFGIRPRLGTDSMHALHKSILTGIGAGIVSTWVVEDDLASGRLVRLAPEWTALPLPVYLVYPYARFYPARLKAFIALVRTHIPQVTGMSPPANRP